MNAVKLLTSLIPLDYLGTNMLALAGSLAKPFSLLYDDYVNHQAFVDRWFSYIPSVDGLNQMIYDETGQAPSDIIIGSEPDENGYSTQYHYPNLPSDEVLRANKLAKYLLPPYSETLITGQTVTLSATFLGIDSNECTIRIRFSSRVSATGTTGGQTGFSLHGPYASTGVVNSISVEEDGYTATIVFGWASGVIPNRVDYNHPGTD